MSTLPTILAKNGFTSKLRDFDLMLDSFDRVFSDFYLDTYRGSLFNKPVFEDLGKSLKTNYGENENEYFIHLQLPGFKKEDLKIKFEENALTISSEVEKTEEKSEKNFFKKEFEKHSFRKVYNLPKNADKESIKASLSDGILNVIVPKKKEEVAKKEYIEIAVQ
jgi:HSP20 family protein